MLKNMKITLKLGLLVGFLCLLSALIGLFGLRNSEQANQRLDTSLEAMNQLTQANILVNQASLKFALQIHEWKNILLRGQDEQNYAVYLAAFKDEQSAVQEALQKLKPLMAEFKLETAQVDEMLLEHESLYAKYMEALKFFERGKADSYIVVDQLVKGMDRKLGGQMAPIAELIAKETEKGIHALRLEAKEKYQEARAISITFMALSLLVGIIASFFLLRSLRQQLGGEPGYAATLANRIAVGDLTVVVETRVGDRTSLMYAMKTMVDKLTQVIGDVRGSADALSSASEEVSATAQSMSQAASEQAASVEETSASVEQMSASITQNTENAKVTDGMAVQAANQATEGGQAVEQMVEAMKQIAKRIGIIDDIAYQTNLLALNAAIEAARAGEHGRGFAVVAGEVRKLAERSQVAAQEIGEMAGKSVAVAEKAGKLLGEMVPSIKKTSDLVQEIAAASEEQSSSVGQVNTAMVQLSQITQQNASSSEELAATAEEMSGQAENLQQLVAFFRIASDTPGAASADALKLVKPEPTPTLPPVSKVPDSKEFVKF